MIIRIFSRALFSAFRVEMEDEDDLETLHYANKVRFRVLTRS